MSLYLYRRCDTILTSGHPLATRPATASRRSPAPTSVPSLPSKLGISSSPTLTSHLLRLPRRTTPASHLRLPHRTTPASHLRLLHRTTPTSHLRLPRRTASIPSYVSLTEPLPPPVYVSLTKPLPPPIYVSLAEPLPPPVYVSLTKPPLPPLTSLSPNRPCLHSPPRHTPSKSVVLLLLLSLFLWCPVRCVVLHEGGAEELLSPPTALSVGTP